MRNHLIKRHHMVVPSKATSDKLFGKYDELVRLVLGFLLTGILGAYLSHKYTTEQADLVAAGKVFNDYSKLAGDRYFVQNRLYLSLRSITKSGSKSNQELLNERLDAYRDAVQLWNSTRGFTREMIKLYFGQPMWSSERDIHYAFRSWGQALEAEKNKAGSVDFECMEHEIDNLLSAINLLQSSMARAMQEGKIGGSKDRQEVKTNDRPSTMCLVGKP